MMEKMMTDIARARVREVLAGKATGTLLVNFVVQGKEVFFEVWEAESVAIAHGEKAEAKRVIWKGTL